MLFCPHDGIMLRIEGLHENPAGRVPPSTPSRNLGYELKGPFRRPEIWNVKGRIGRYHTDKGNVREVMSLCNHLGTYKYINIPAV